MDADIYEDLPDFRYDVTLDQLRDSVKKLEAENDNLQSKLMLVSEEKKSLNFNYTALYKTAKLEIRRKERTIAELRERLKTVVPSGKQVGLTKQNKNVGTRGPLKRQREISPSPSPRKKRKGIVTRGRGNVTPRKNQPLRSPHPKDSRQSCRRKTYDDDRLVQKLEKTSEDPPLGKNTSATVHSPVPSKTLLDSTSIKVPPSLPSVACPTVFSGRMYKRIYGSSPAKTSPSGVPSNKIHVSDEDELSRAPSLSTHGRPTQKSSPCRRVTPEDIRTYLKMEDPFESDSSCSSTDHSRLLGSTFVKLRSELPGAPQATVKSELPPRKPVVEDLSVPQMPVVAEHFCSTVNANVIVNFESQKLIEPPSNELELPPPPPRTVDQQPISRPSDVVENYSLKVNSCTSAIDSVAKSPKHAQSSPITLEVPLNVGSMVSATSVDKNESLQVNSKTSKKGAQQDIINEPQNYAGRTCDKSPVTKVNLLAVRKTRKQTTAAIRPIQKVTAQGQRTTIDVSHEVGKASQGCKSAEAKPSEAVHSAEKPSRLLKVPGLPGSTKGRTVRQVFAPISNQWNYSLPTSGDRNDSERRSEVSVVQTVSVTSELTVRVEDSKFDELKRQSLAEDVFGSPVKWADDSLDSHVEGSPNSRKATYYSIFGSPLKGVDSNSSEHPFTVSPGAYEESCWTNQVPEKVQKSSLGEPQPLKQNQRSQDADSVAEATPEGSLVPNETVTAGTTTCLPPPPPPSVIKKHVSIFSPSRHSKHSNPSPIVDDRSRSNTGIFFPFSRPRYEDSVLGQFDDTAQFVSALTNNFKVNSQISPLSTPTKAEESGSVQSVIVKSNPTSFQEVFKKAAPGNPLQVNEPPNFDKAVGMTAIRKSNVSEPLLGENDHVDSSEHVLPADTAEGLCKHKSPTCSGAEHPRPSIEPPIITITPSESKSRQDYKIVHRPNLTSSTICYSVKSWFPKDTPINMVAPRRTPRLVSKPSPSTSPNGLAKFSIDDAFIFEQEERFKRWELDRLDNHSLRGADSTTKGMTGSPTRKRLELLGKTSPSKKSPRKQNSPNKRRSEVCRNILNPDCADSSTDASLKRQHADVPNQPTSETCAHPDVPDGTPPAPKSLPDMSPNLLSMLGTLLNNTNPQEAKAKVRPVDAKDISRPLTSPKSQVEVKPDSEAPVDSGLHLKQADMVTSPEFHHADQTPADIESNIPPQITGSEPAGSALDNHQDVAAGQTSCSDSPASPVPGVSNTDARVPPGPVKLAAKTNEAPAPKRIPKPPNSSGRPNTPASAVKLKNRVGNFISIVKPTKPSPPPNKSVAALIKCTSNSAQLTPRPRITAPIIQPTRSCNFKRSSAFKANNKDGAGNSQMDAIRSTFFQGTPTSSKKNNGDAQERTPTSSVIGRTRALKEGDNSVQKSTDPDATSRKNNLSTNEEMAERVGVASIQQVEAHPKRNQATIQSPKPEVKLTPPDKWSLFEIERTSKPISLFKKFQKSVEQHRGIASGSPNTGEPYGAKPKPGNSETQPMTSSEGVKVITKPPTSPFPKRILRKTILLDSPLKLDPPINKRKRSVPAVPLTIPQPEKPITPSGASGEVRIPRGKKVHFDETPRGKESAVDKVEATPRKANKKCAEPITGVDENETIDKTSPKNCKERQAGREMRRGERRDMNKKRDGERESRHIALHRPYFRIDIRARYPERYARRGFSREMSATRLLGAKRDVTPAPRHQKSRGVSRERSDGKATQPRDKSDRKISSDHRSEPSKSTRTARRSRSASPQSIARRHKPSSKSVERTKSESSPSHCNSREQPEPNSPHTALAQVVPKLTPQAQPTATSAISAFKKLGLLGRRPASFSRT